MNNKVIMNTREQRLLGLSIMLTCMMLQAIPVAAITVSSTLFQGSTYNLMTDDSGNEWLSLLATDGQAYDLVSNQIDNAVGDYADYRFATQPEVVALFTDYGAQNFDIGATDADFPFASALQNDFGSTGAISFGEPLTWGYTSTILVQGTNSFPNFHLSPFVRVQTSAGEAQFRTSLSVDVINDPNLHLRGSWLIRNTAVPGGSADFDFDLDVDGADFLMWQRGFGSLYDASNLADWESQFGTAAVLAAGVAVPEPSTLSLFALSLLTFFRSLFRLSPGATAGLSSSAA